MKIFKVTASSGVSLICQEGQTMLGWIEYIVARGEVPTIQVLADAELAEAA